MHAIEVITPASTMPVSLVEAITQCNAVAGQDDALLHTLIAAATATVETAAGMTLRAQNVRLVFWDLPETIVELEIPEPYFPVTNITAIKYRDQDGAQQTLATSIYQSNLISRPPRIAVKPNQSWPTMRHGDYDQLVIEGSIGTPTPPEQARQAILLLVGHWFLNREASISGSIKAVELAFGMLVDQLQLYRYP